MLDDLIDAAEDNAIWRATHPREAREADDRLNHWAHTGHIGCACPVHSPATFRTPCRTPYARTSYDRSRVTCGECLAATVPICNRCGAEQRHEERETYCRYPDIPHDYPEQP